jgi:hypothetical protein
LARKVATQIGRDLNDGISVFSPTIPQRVINEHKGRVYFVEAVGLSAVKIGAAANIRRRIGQLQIGCPAELRILFHEEGGKVREQELHRTFGAQRIRGDWFRLEGQVAEYVSRNCR